MPITNIDNVSNMENEVKIVVKWSGKEYEISHLSQDDCVGTLKNAIHKETGVRPERQKLLNLKLKGNSKIFRKFNSS